MQVLRALYRSYEGGRGNSEPALERGLLPADSPGEREGIPPPPIQKGKLRPTPHARLVWPGSQPSCLCCQLDSVSPSVPEEAG